MPWKAKRILFAAAVRSHLRVRQLPDRQNVRGVGMLSLFAKTTPRDLGAAMKVVKIQAGQGWFFRTSKGVVDIFEKVAARKSEKVMMICDDKTYTFSQAKEYVDRVATYFSSIGLKRGDDVALYMENRPEFILLWLGLSKIGVATALVNNQLQNDPLVHCATSVNSKAIIYSPKTAVNIEAVHSRLQAKNPDLKYFTLGEPTGKIRSENLAQLLDGTVPKTLKGERGLFDPLIYIFTSGTEGLPKAAIISNAKFICLGVVIYHITGIRANDVFYLCLPLYHLSGGVCGCSQVVMYGCTAAIAQKFSAKQFWNDCTKHKVTVVQYIGEICRYLLSEPVKPEETQHNIRTMYGNGLRPQIWKEFQTRFKIPNIRELYGSTEGNCNLMNTDNTVGAIGFVPTIARCLPHAITKYIYPIKVVKLDDDGAPLRDKNGICVQIKEGEVGEIVGLISERNINRFDGYVDKQATKRKIYKDLFARGDQGFASSDLLYMDELGYLFFVDRTGDTFRWKGENVSTTEVEGVISEICGKKDAIVFGVPVPHSEGKAGMAVIEDDDSLDVNSFLEKAKKILPAYAIPIFVRLVKQIDRTSTHKLKKTDYAKTGYELNKHGDPLYFLDNGKKYIRLDESILEDIRSGRRRL